MLATLVHPSEDVFRGDKIKVPTLARDEFLQRVIATHSFWIDRGNYRYGSGSR